MGDHVLVGKLVAGRYRVVRRLGAGGMGTVYVAVQEPLGREVALKVVRRDLSGDERTVERFRREAQTLSQAHHPHIVTIYDFGALDDGALYFAMELVRGENLRQRLNRVGPLAVKKTLSIVRDTSSALAEAHALGIIHRDLKPENILLMEAAGSPDFVKIVDFGVAKLVSDDSLKDQEQLTQRGSVVGTPGYIAPEVALQGVTTDVRSDLYALGVVWFECLTGRPPYRSPTATALLMAHALDPVPSLPSEIPLAVAGLVQRLLAKNPDDRPESAEELSALIDAMPILDSNPSVSRPNFVVSSDGATLEDARHSPRHSPRPSGPDAHSNPPTHPTEEISAPRAKAPPPVSSSADTKVTDPVPLPVLAAAPHIAPIDRRAILGAALLIAVAIVVAAVVSAIVSHSATPKGAVVDGGVASVHAVVDAGAASVHVVVDAGPAPKKKPGPVVHKKPPPDGEHAPDIYSP